MELSPPEHGQGLKKLLQEIEAMYTSEVSELRAQVTELQSQLFDRPVGPRVSQKLLPVPPAVPQDQRVASKTQTVFDIDNPSVDSPRGSRDLDDETSKKLQEYERKLDHLQLRGRSCSMQSSAYSMDGTPEPIEEEEEEDVVENNNALDRLSDIFVGPHFEFVICMLLLVNLIMMAAQLQYHGMRTGYSISFPRYRIPPEEIWPYAEDLFVWGDWIFAIIFTIEMLIRLGKIRCQFFRHFLNWIDFVVVCSSWVELFAATLPISPTFLRMLRLGKLLRAVRVVRLSQVLESLQLLLKCIAASLKILFWSLVLLMVIQCSAGMTISYMLSDFMVTDDGNAEARFQVFRYYGTFSKTLLTMFEVLFANWAPACRVLIDNVSEWWALGFIVYRCFVGFAVLNVVNAVFIQTTMKVAHEDEEVIAFEKTKAQEIYRRRVNNMFREADTSGDGCIDFQEFQRMLEHPQLQVWLHQLEIQTDDLLGLFSMLDDGDGEISLEEFETGILKIKGMARSVDINKLQRQVRKMNAKLDFMLMQNNLSDVQQSLPKMDRASRKVVSKGSPGASASGGESMSNTPMWKPQLRATPDATS